MRKLAALVVAALALSCGGTAPRPGEATREPPAPPDAHWREPEPSHAPHPPHRAIERGKATWYGGGHQGGPTASGERFDKRKLTAAHKHLPLNTIVRVTNLKNGKSVEVRINDRGPYGRGHIIDLSEAAARRIDMIGDGIVPVTVEVVAEPPPRKRRR